MALVLEMTPEQQDRIEAAARQRGESPGRFAVALLLDNLPPPAPPTVDSENAAAIALLQSFLRDEATDDPEQIRHSEKELADFKRMMNAERAANGERLLFP